MSSTTTTNKEDVNEVKDDYELICNSVDEDHSDKQDSVLVSYEKSKITEDVFGVNDLKITIIAIIIKVIFGILIIYIFYVIFNIMFKKIFANISKSSRILKR